MDMVQNRHVETKDMVKGENSSNSIYWVLRAHRVNHSKASKPGVCRATADKYKREGVNSPVQVPTLLPPHGYSPSGLPKQTKFHLWMTWIQVMAILFQSLRCSGSALQRKCSLGNGEPRASFREQRPLSGYSETTKRMNSRQPVLSWRTQRPLRTALLRLALYESYAFLPQSSYLMSLINW